MKRAFEKIAAGLEDAIAHARNGGTRAREAAVDVNPNPSRRVSAPPREPDVPPQPHSS